MRSMRAATAVAATVLAAVACALVITGSTQGPTGVPVEYQVAAMALLRLYACESCSHCGKAASS